MMDRLNLVSAAGLAFLLQPWGLIAAGAATVSQADLSEPGTVVTVVAFCLIGTLTYIAMEVYVIVAPDVSRTRLNNLRAGIDAHRDQAIIAGSLIVGLWLIGKSAYLLA